jgi:polysaccharide biosynthesis protein VpsQ
MKKHYFCLVMIWFVFLGWIVLRADTGTMPSLLAQVNEIPNGDKVGHFFLMGILALFINLAFPKWQYRFFSINFPGGSMLTAVIVTFEEISQIYFKTRTFDLSDLTADYLGIIIMGGVVFHLIQRHHLQGLKWGMDRFFSN